MKTFDNKIFIFYQMKFDMFTKSQDKAKITEKYKHMICDVMIGVQAF